MNQRYWRALAFSASESGGMRFVRGGVVNLLMRLPRSNLLTVGYRIHGGYLERLARH